MATPLGWLEARLRAIAQDHPALIKKLFHSFYTEKQVGKAVLLQQFGYKPIRFGQEMVRPTLDDIPDHPMPEGLEFRPVTPDHFRLMWKAGNEAFRDHWGAGQPDKRDYRNWLEQPFGFQPHLWQVAWDCLICHGPPSTPSFLSPILPGFGPEPLSSTAQALGLRFFPGFCGLESARPDQNKDIYRTKKV